MNLDLFNNILNNVKENDFVQNFIKELSNHLENVNNKLPKNGMNLSDLKQENCLYQVVEMGVDSAYLRNINTNQVSKETDISKEILDKIGNDSVLRYKNGKYIIEDELTQKFFDSLIEIDEFEKIQNDFEKESNILDIDSNTKYKIQQKEQNYCILSYSDNKDKIKVPNALIPFWASIGENLYYKNGKFNRCK